MTDPCFSDNRLALSGDAPILSARPVKRPPISFVVDRLYGKLERLVKRSNAGVEVGGQPPLALESALD